jgi:hypothetical protein
MNWPLFFVTALVFGIARLAFYRGDHLGAKAEKKHVWERAGAGIATLATFGLILSMSGWLGSAWNHVGAGIGLVILIVVTAAAVGWGGFAIFRGFAHHRHSTLAAGVIAGASVALVYGDFRAIRANIGVYLATAGHGITSAPTTVHTATTAHGHAAGHAASHTASSAGLIGLILILVAAGVLGWIAVSRHRNGQVRNVGAAAGTKAIGAGSKGSKGSRGGGLPAGRGGSFPAGGFPAGNDLAPTYGGDL